jgi:general stress protein 26
MPTPAELEAKFWSSLKSDMTMMLGLDGVEDGHARPMTAQFQGEKGPIWFFTSDQNGVVKNLGGQSRAIATFTSKGHDLFATVHGRISLEQNRAMVDALWNPYVAAWYSGGKTDPALRLLRLDAERAEIWADGSSLIAGLKMLFGADPKQEFKENVAKVQLK